MRTQDEIVMAIRQLMQIRNKLAFADKRRELIQDRLNVLLWTMGLPSNDPAAGLERNW